MTGAIETITSSSSPTSANCPTPLHPRGFVPATGPYTVQVVDRAGGVQSFGQLAPNGNGDLFYGNFTSQDLSKAITVSILDRASDVVLSGKVALYSAG